MYKLPPIRRKLAFLRYGWHSWLRTWLWLVLALAAAHAVGVAAAEAPTSAAIATPGPVREIDRILVVVNDDVITQSELDSRLKEVERRIAAEREAFEEEYAAFLVKPQPSLPIAA